MKMRALLVAVIACAGQASAQDKPLHDAYETRWAPRLVPMLVEVVRFPTYAGNDRAFTDQKAWLARTAIILSGLAVLSTISFGGLWLRLGAGPIDHGQIVAQGVRQPGKHRLGFADGFTDLQEVANDQRDPEPRTKHAPPAERQRHG